MRAGGKINSNSLQKRWVSNFDWQIGLSMLLICCAGLVVLRSAGFDPDTQTSAQMQRQLISMIMGLVAFSIGMMIPTNFLRRSAYFVYGGSCAALVASLAHGVVAGGARRWIDVAGVRFQPSEFMKIALILALARLFSTERSPRNGYTFFSLFIPGAMIMLPVVLIVDQPDLGTALCQIFIGGSMLLVAGIQTGTLIRLGLIGALFAPLSWHFLKDYQKNRILNFFTPDLDPLGSGYHAIQSKIAVGSGAWMGKGFLKGTQTQLRFLPEQTTDFIFSVLAEEWGFLGSFIVISLYAFLIFRLVQVAAKTTDRFSGFVVVGVATMIFWQVVVNTGMVIGIMPVVGITLPLLSYGGSSVMTVMFSLGLAAGVSRRRFLFS